MSDQAATEERQGGLTDEEKRINVIRLVFNNDPAQYEAFVKTIREALPAGTSVVLRGSAVTGERWKDRAPFDAEGPGTSDLDLTLVGSEVVGLFELTGFYVPGVHSRPLCDDDPDIAPSLVPLRQRLMDMVKRPVNIQASRELVMTLRGDVLGQPYLTLIEVPDTVSVPPQPEMPEPETPGPEKPAGKAGPEKPGPEKARAEKPGPEKD
jgi:hypothetical protein